MSANGGAQDIAAIFGAAFDDGRGHVQAYATYRTQDPVLESTRDFSFCALGSFQPQYVAAYGEYYCGGSSTTDTGTFNHFSPTGQLLNQYHVQGNQFVQGATLFNYAPYNYFQRPDERYTFGAFADYEISPAFRPYLEVMFMHDRTDALIAPSGDFGNTRFLNCDNPLMSAQQRQILCGDPFSGRHFDDAGPSDQHFQRERFDARGVVKEMTRCIDVGACVGTKVQGRDIRAVAPCNPLDRLEAERRVPWVIRKIRVERH